MIKLWIRVCNIKNLYGIHYLFHTRAELHNCNKTCLNALHLAQYGTIKLTQIPYNWQISNGVDHIHGKTCPILQSKDPKSLVHLSKHFDKSSSGKPLSGLNNAYQCQELQSKSTNGKNYQKIKKAPLSQKFCS